MDNRSEPRGWLADGNPDGTDPQDAEQAAPVRTVLSSAPDTGTADFSPDTAFSADPGFGSDAGYTDAGYASAHGGSEQPGSHANGGYGYSAAASQSGNGASSGATIPPSSWSAGAEAPPPPPAAGADAGASYSGAGAGAASGYDAYGTSSPAADPARAAAAGTAFPSPASSRPKGGRPGKSAGSGRPAAARPAAAAASAVSTRRAQLTVSRIEPWSVMKFSFMISLVGWVILFIAVSVLYFLLSKLGVFNSIENTVGLVTAGKNNPGTNASSWFSASRVLGYTMLAGAVNVILITALATVGSVLYNLVTLLAGGIEVTLKETE